MQGHSGRKAPTGIALVVVALGILLFFLVVDIQYLFLRWLTFGFLVTASVALVFGVTVLVSQRHVLEQRHNKVFLFPGIISTLFVYFCICVVSMFIVEAFVGRVGLFIFLNLLLIGLVGITLLAMTFASRSVALSEARTKSDMAFMELCQATAQRLMVDHNNKEYATQLNDLYENIRFADKVGHTDADTNIFAALQKLEAALGDDDRAQHNIQKIFEDLKSYLAMRKGLMSQAKRGGF